MLLSLTTKTEVRQGQTIRDHLIAESCTCCSNQPRLPEDNSQVSPKLFPGIINCYLVGAFYNIVPVRPEVTEARICC